MLTYDTWRHIIFSIWSKAEETPLSVLVLCFFLTNKAVTSIYIVCLVAFPCSVRTYVQSVYLCTVYSARPSLIKNFAFYSLLICQFFCFDWSKRYTSYGKQACAKQSHTRFISIWCPQLVSDYKPCSTRIFWGQF